MLLTLLLARYNSAYHSLLVNRNDHAWAAGLNSLGTPSASAATGVAAKLILGATLRLCDIRKVPGQLILVR